MRGCIVRAGAIYVPPYFAEDFGSRREKISVLFAVSEKMENLFAFTAIYFARMGTLFASVRLDKHILEWRRLAL